jgi:hypothetical protein
MMYTETRDNDTDMQENLVVLFDIALTPDHLVSDYAPSQDQVFQAAVFNVEFDQDEEDSFDCQPKRRRTLEYYKRLYDSNNSMQVMLLLDHWTEIDFRNSSFVTHSSSMEMLWMPQDHFLDLMICVSDRLGLGALLPNLRVHHNYEMTMDDAWDMFGSVCNSISPLLLSLQGT